jgi:hypothetical protein
MERFRHLIPLKASLESPYFSSLRNYSFTVQSTKSQAPAFAEAASRRQAKSQINPNDQNSIQNRLGHLRLDIGVYLKFGI